MVERGIPSDDRLPSSLDSWERKHVEYVMLALALGLIAHEHDNVESKEESCYIELFIRTYLPTYLGT
jgi:hypothetical protein